MSTAPTIDPINLKILTEQLSDQYRVRLAANGARADDIAVIAVRYVDTK